MMRGLPTVYGGVRFRSRLEARWSYQLSAADLRWEYEPRRFLLSGGRRYTPDFHLPDHDLWIEIKPASTAYVASDSEELAAALSRLSEVARMTGDRVALFIGEAGGKSYYASNGRCDDSLGIALRVILSYSLAFPQGEAA